MLIDITRKLTSELYVYPGDPAFRTHEICSTDSGDICTVSEICLGTHSGTHIDAPSHFITGGRSVSSYSLNELCGRAKVFEVCKYEIGTDDIAGLQIEQNDIILFKTLNKVFDGRIPLNRHSYLSDEAALFLADKKIKLAGIDYITVDNEASNNYPAHKILLGSGIPILENIDLSSVSPGIYNLYCFPLFTDAIDAAPVRAALEII